MHRFLITLAYIIFVSNINGDGIQSPTSIDEDAIEFAGLIAKFWSLKPAVFQKLEPFIYCQVIEECCGDEQHSQAIPLWFPSSYNDDIKSHFVEVINECVNSTTLNEANQWCSSFRQSIISSKVFDQDPNAKRFKTMIAKYKNELRRVFGQIYITCNNEEIYAFLCLSNKKLIETCAGKILGNRHSLFSFSYQYYEEYITKGKQILIDVNQELSQMSFKNTNTI